MKTWQWESWKLKLVRERQIYDYCPSAFGERAAGRKANRHDTELRPALHTERTSPPELRLCFVFIILMAGILNKPNFMTIWLCIVSCSNDSIGWCARWNSWWLCFLALYAWIFHTCDAITPTAYLSLFGLELHARAGYVYRDLFLIDGLKWKHEIC